MSFQKKTNQLHLRVLHGRLPFARSLEKSWVSNFMSFPPLLQFLIMRELESLAKAEGEKTPPAVEESILPDIEDDGMMRVEMSPGGTIRQIITKPQMMLQQQKKQQSVLQKKQHQQQPVNKSRNVASKLMY